MEDKLNVRPSKLSGGQQQRVAVARALASKPQFVLADEPTANLDSKSASNLLDIMAMLNKEEKITFLFSTHDQRVIDRARRVITLVDGKIASDTAAVDTNVTHPHEVENKMKRILTIVFFIVATSCIAQDDSTATKKKWQLSGYIKNLESLSFDKNFNNSISGNLLHNRLNIKWNPTNKMTAAVEFRNRLFWGEEVKTIPNFASQLRNDNEKVNMQKAWIQKQSLVLHTNTERLYFDYREDYLNVRIGRQRINWGITTTWNPNDIFNTYNFLDFDYEERPGVDGGKFQYIFNNSFNTEIAYAHTGKKDGDVAALKYNLNKWGYDMQLITGWYNDHITMGAGWAGSIKDAGFKGEAQYFFRDKDSTDHFNMSLEGDYMFKKGWYLNFGVLFTNQGLTKPVKDWSVVNLKLSPENLMPTKWNFILTAAKEITPLFSAKYECVVCAGHQPAYSSPFF